MLDPQQQRIFRRAVSVGAALLLSLGLTGSAASAAEGEPQISRAEVGFNGAYRTGFWSAVRIEVVGGDAEFRGTLAATVLDGDGLPVRNVWGSDQPLSIPANETVVWERYIKFGRATTRVEFELSGTSGGEPVSVRSGHEIPSPLRSDRELILSLGGKVGSGDLGLGRARGEAAPVFQSVTAEQLPSSWLGYEGVTALLVTTSDPATVDQLQPAQIAALQQWIELGGRLVLCAGERGEQLFGSGGQWMGLAPGEFAQVGQLRNTSSLESYTGSSQRLEASPNGIPMTVLRNVRGRVELLDTGVSGDRPLIVRSPKGLGQILFVAVDLDRPPFTEWEGGSRLIQRVVREAAGLSELGRDDRIPGAGVQFGYTDVAGQLRSALDQFPDVTLAAFSWVAGLLLLYVLLIGPADYFFLRDLVGRMPLTWISFPAIAALFVGLAIFLNARLRGESVEVNQLDLVDVDRVSGTVRGTSWVHIYSPAAGVHDLDLWLAGQQSLMPSAGGQVLAWQGLPGAALGGLDANTSAIAPAVGSCEIRFAAPEQCSMTGVPFPVASTRSLLGRWWGRSTPAQASPLVRDRDGLLRGELINPLPHDLTDCLVFFENWVYRLDSRQGVLAAGERTRVENERALNLQWRLTGRRVIDAKDVSTAWDQNTLDSAKILEMMMFHGAAGGENYTRLAHRYQGYVDLSDHLYMGRAILLGRARTPAAAFSLDGQSPSGGQQTAYYRVIFPVESQRD